jgi:hypothetical protein
MHLSRDDIEEPIDEEEYDSDSDSSNESEAKMMILKRALITIMR